MVESPTPFLPLMQSLLERPLQKQVVFYVKPHFRFRNRTFETKRVESVQAVYHDALWFRWVHSVETPYRAWSRSTYATFLHHVGNFQDPFAVETRHVLAIDAHAQLYTFQSSVRSFRLVFEWEYGTFPRPRTRFDPERLLGALQRYRRFYDLLRDHPAPPFQLNEQMTRRPVTCIESVPRGANYLYAHKWDGIFGLVYSYRDQIKEKWEGYECVVRRGASLGEGIVFAAERLEGGEVCLLDVYQVRGHETARWCRKAILTQFLPRLKVAEGYFVQAYAPEVPSADPPFRTDGIIVHDVARDVIYKYKTNHTVDLVYHRGYFYLPTGRIKCSEEGLEEGSVYEIAIRDGSVVRKRVDRFKGNTAEQLENVLKHGWHGPPIEPLPASSKRRRRPLGHKEC